ncbi:MAG: hypothetical protein IT375_23145 [Polyangiaceae bacterium]|nr:hypothetical protein [Polyangiaceae bacterium]MCK6535897.1 hypothetical protein [Polyangiaceae bacterium]
MRKALALGLLISCFAVPVRADVPPIDYCSKVGEACQNAGNEGKSAGTCTKSMCTTLNKFTGKSETHECTKCIEGPPPSPPKKQSGCATRPGRVDPSGVVFLFGALLCGAACRRRGR